MEHLVAQSRNIHRLVGQLDRGQDLHQGLLSVCEGRQIRCCTIQATGVLETLALSHYEPSNRSMGPARHFRGSMMMLGTNGLLCELKGTLDLRLYVTASRQRDNGVEVLGGVCTAGKVLTCEFVIEVMDDLLLRRDLDRSTGLHQLHEAFSAQDTARASSGGNGPAGDPAPDASAGEPDKEVDAERFVTRATETRPLEEKPLRRLTSDSTPRQDEEEAEPYRPVRPGDIIEHRQFGRCEVQRVSGEDEFVTVRLRNKRLVRLSMDVLDLRFKEEEEEGHQVFIPSPSK